MSLIKPNNKSEPVLTKNCFFYRLPFSKNENWIFFGYVPRYLVNPHEIKSKLATFSSHFKNVEIGKNSIEENVKKYMQLQANC